MNYDAVVVGSGFAGSVSARILAEEQGKRVLVLEKRDHAGGNMHDGLHESGVLVHWYGPHIFHTNDGEVYEYLRRFTDPVPYRHRVLGRIDGRLVPIPFNFTSMDILFEPEKAARLQEKLLSGIRGRQVTVLELLGHPDEEIASFGQYVYDNVFKNYTEKQWGVRVQQVDPATIGRVPVVLGRNDLYFSDAYQCMPGSGYAPLFHKMLDHPLIDVRLGCDAGSLIALDGLSGTVFLEGERMDVPMIYTGSIDALFGYRYGALPYRSLMLEYEEHACESFQQAAVVNYPNEERFTRITEFKHLTGQVAPGRTVTLKEYPVPYDKDSGNGSIPYYPIAGEANSALYNRYKLEAERFGSIRPCGRLAEYKYYNMDIVIKRAIQTARAIQ